MNEHSGVAAVPERRQDVRFIDDAEAASSILLQNLQRYKDPCRYAAEFGDAHRRGCMRCFTAVRVPPPC